MNNRYREFLLEGERVGMRYALAVPRTTSATLAGLQMGQRAGSSLEFKDHRDYQPGDDLRRIDWNAFARSDKLTVKLFREEISPHLDVVLDGSRSMAVEPGAKAHAATALAAALAVAAENAGYSHAAWLAREWCAPIANGGGRPSLWDDIGFDYSGNPAESFANVPPKLRRQGLRVFISDLLWLGEPLQLLQQLSHNAASVVIVQVLGEADVAPVERGRIRLIDSETEEQREIFIDEAAIRRYREALARHRQNWNQSCRQSGATMVELIAEKVLADWNLEALVKADVLKV
ncbi:MAG TPA: DUF58 domain-containing protein [Blastocatellia bacterium]|nr:DUF58 domain-containing protein [Blastocatellia bacterium]HMV86082.1 DUF58 domain-containing protein [Blastocatellia bacterium]HMZ22520.1 DUF58 domain-containing protein [Blastocatellia bacterium]HNG31972.1 DUF58 domain-containing protein [Blastocatellia bacterium]